jgi:hypothetical protein
MNIPSYKRDRTRPRPAELPPKEIVRRDRLRASAFKWMGKPPGLPKALARQFEREAKGGKTIKDLTDLRSKSYIVPHSRFRKHCTINPAWGKRMYRLSDVNSGKKKSDNSNRAVATRTMCLRGLHPMKAHNLMLDTNAGRPRRRCRACFMARMHGKPMTTETMERLKKAINDGTPLAEILHGNPLGGGPKDRSLAITTAAKFNHQREIDPDFARFVNEHIVDNNSIGQIARRARDGLKKKNPDAVLPREMRPTVVAIARLRRRLRTVDKDGKLAARLDLEKNREKRNEKQREVRKKHTASQREKRNASQRERRRKRRLDAMSNVAEKPG